MEIYSELQRLAARAVTLAEDGSQGDLSSALSELQALTLHLTKPPTSALRRSDVEALSEREARRRREDEEIEQRFDNMPV